MTYTGTVRNGVVVFENGRPPDGTVVRVEPVGGGAAELRLDELEAERLADELAQLEGTIELPPDFSEQHDHYLHGQPKK